MAPYKILKQGYMEKEPPLSKRGLRKKLVRYWFVLVEDKKQVALVYFRNEDQYIARQRNEGFIRVDESESISVVGDYMSRKHAFIIKTRKGEYTLAPESRYDLHEWLFTLHNSLEVFKKRQEKTRQRPAIRQRSNTLDSNNSPAQRGASGASGGGQRTPPHTPSRRAPPPPVQRRRPHHRPAPGPPPSTTGQSPAEYPSVDDETPPPSYSVSDSVAMSHDVDLDISLVDHDIGENGNEEGRYPLNEPNDPGLDTRSNLMHQTSSSMPDLLTHDVEDTPTTSPEEEGVNEQGQQGSPLQEIHLHTRHTRHHSLTITEIKAKKKRSTRRQGSLKVRSRSPPELPPPPPPEGETPTSPTPLEEPTNGLTGEGSSTSLGLGGVMDALDDIEQQIDEMSSEDFSPKPSVPAPIRGFPYKPERSGSPDGFDENEWLCDEPLNHAPLNHAPLENEVRQGILASPENAQTETIPPTIMVLANPRKGKQVMFKEEVEDIPITYEPVADGNYDSSDDEVLPSSVAELKKRLFGDREGEAARYKREGPLSPSHTHPLNTSFDGGYDYEGQSSPEKPPNINNNNSGGGDASNHDNETPLDDHAWDCKAVTTFKPSHETTPIHSVTTPTVLETTVPETAPIVHETTPPPVAPKPTHTASVWNQRSALTTMDNGSLLSSISCTLQETSKYGSDSLLSSGYEATKKKSEVRFSSKGELEKIRAEHRRDPPPPPQAGDSPSPQTGNSPQAMKRKWPNGRSFAGPPRNAGSLDTLSDTKPMDTRVTYDANTNSHIYRSLV